MTMSGSTGPKCNYPNYAYRPGDNFFSLRSSALYTTLLQEEHLEGARSSIDLSERTKA